MPTHVHRDNAESWIYSICVKGGGYLWRNASGCDTKRVLSKDSLKVVYSFATSNSSPPNILCYSKCW